MTLNIVILSAGLSSRMNSNIPKVMHLIAERPVLGYVLETAIKANAYKIILVTSPAMKNVRDYAETQYSNIIHATQENPLGTGDAVKSALTHIDSNGHTLVMYGDTPFVSIETIKKIANSNADITILGFNTNNPNKYGRLITQNSRLIKIVEYNDASEEEKSLTLCNSGIFLINNQYIKKLISAIKNNNAKSEYYLTDIIEIAISQKLTCEVLSIDEKEVIGINTREDLVNAQKIMQENIVDNLLKQGVTIISPETSFIAYDFMAGKDVTIYPNVFISKEVKVADGVIIRSFSHIEQADISSNVTIGPFARIRPGSKIEQNAKIGNFVEIKNSHIKEKAKISHLSYIGDSEIGKETNIGAGTITCNYDGISKKAKTTIGDKVSIGSNTCLVAPVNIADRAYIAAGSVITNNVEEDDLAFGRSKQINYPKGAKKYRNEQ